MKQTPKKMPRDVNQRAKMIVDILTGTQSDSTSKPVKKKRTAKKKSGKRKSR